ncbi:MAG TPA: cytochrome c3 family protein [Gemmatimonadaceae bacterium]|nr:cytochrome c3 family protein [Gemmatimonadaceae bacterium]
MKVTIRRLIVPVVLLVATAALAMQQSRAPFPHAQHAKLFPTCAGCHSGIVSGDSALMFPSPDDCAQCHNGSDVRRIAWTGPSARVTNLKFSHTEHATMSAQGGTAADCANCHGLQAGRDTAWMHIAGADPSACLACHRAPQHLAASADCSTCHKTLVQATTLSATAIAAFPKPSSHSNPDWLARHAPQNAGQMAQCAICHARESCARCHPNADKLPAIKALGSDARVASLVRNVLPVYFTPAAHRETKWAYGHGADARANPQTCASCHTQTSCRSCHIGNLGADVIAKLPDAKPGRAPGVVLVKASRAGAAPLDAAPPARAVNAAEVTRPLAPQDTVLMRVHVHPDGFATNHKSAAASGQLNCQGCHQPRDCTSCHDGVSTRRDFHPDDFMARHANSAYTQDQNCSSCHRVETFCRSCHQKSGIATTGGVRGTAHTGQPLWLLQHGQAARQGLTTCTSCHQQRDCLRCHSSLGMHVNPHGPDFNAQAMGSRNMQMCMVCHLTNPLKK